MDLTKFRTGNYLKSNDVTTIAKLWTIVEAKEEQMPDGLKAILEVEVTTPKDGYVKKDFTLNMTNINRLNECFDCYDTTQMVGKKIVLKVDKVEFRGKRVDGIRINVEQTVALNKDRTENIK